MVESLPGIRATPVTDWFEDHIEGARGPLSFQRIEGGHSNLTYRVDDAGGRSYVLRRPPLGTLLATAHDMAREHRIISAVGPTSVPVPPALGLCEDDSINDAPFYVMAFIEGRVLEDAETAQRALPVQHRPELGRHVVEILVDLHALDPDAVGLGTLGKKQAYLERQLKRWSRQWEGAKTRELPLMEDVAAGLAQQLPPQIGTAIVHGDYRIGNMLTSEAGRVVAVLDWELCTLGDPLADLGYLLNNWALEGETSAIQRGIQLPPTAAGGFPDREAVVDLYAQLSGRDVSKVPFYRAFQYWRSGAIVEGVLDRYLQGKMAGSLDTDLYRERVEKLAEAAHSMLSSLP